MRLDVIADVAARPSGRVRLTGRVGGVEACEIVADGDEIVVGSDIRCDMVVPDPLIPPRAFRLRREKCHAGTDRDCRCRWVLEVFREARVCVNRRLTRHEKLAYGDVLSIGCHDLEFGKEPDAPRNARSNRNVSDICRKLMADVPLPPGFRKNTPTHQYLVRRRMAASAVGLLAAILLLCVWMAPREEYFAPVQPALDINLTDAVLPAEAVRSLEEVVRQSFDTKDPTIDKADLVESKPRIDALAPPPLVRDRTVAPAAPPTLSGPILDSGALNPLPLVADVPANVEIERAAVKLAAAAPASKQTMAAVDGSAEKPVLAKRSERTGNVIASVLDAAKPDPLRPPQEIPFASASPSWKLSAMRPANVEARGPVILREAAKLASSAPARRRSVEEAAQRATERSDLAGYRVKMDQGMARNVTAKTVDQNLAAGLGKPSADNLSVDRAAYMAQLARYKASPVQFEEFRGMQVPVARISEQLARLEVATPPAENALTVDGAVNASEMDVCWKSGRFKTHTPGVPPPDADPATHGYVGRAEVDGKPCLYISFVCTDPDVSQIKASGAQGVAATLIRDDSIEVYLDTNNDRKDYYQVVVNARGDYWTGYWATPMSSGGKAGSWNCNPAIKCTINKSGGQWACEIMIPFDTLGGVPKKGTRWAVNFCRNYRGQVEDWQLQSWFAVYDQKRDFHHPNLFGIFQW